MHQIHNSLDTNSLESLGRLPYRFRKLNRRPKVTIAIGVISDNQTTDKRYPEKRPAIFLASDSQTTYAGATKTLDAQKIVPITFIDGQALVAQSGSSERGDKVNEL